MPYHLPDNYSRRAETVQLDPHRPRDVVWQPDVYPHAVDIARRLGVGHLVDIGCGNGSRVAEYADEFAVIGIDSDVGRIDLPGEWIAHNLDKRVKLPVAEPVLADAVLICADVIEHMSHPDRLRNAIGHALAHAPTAVLSTPDRVLVRGSDHMGPPPNTAHAQEWTLEEFVAFLSEKMTVVDAGYTRQRDTSDALSTCLVEVTARPRRSNATASWSGDGDDTLGEL